MRGGDYNNQVFKQLQAVMEKCDDLSQEIKDVKREHKKEILELKAKHIKEIDNLNNKIDLLEQENVCLKSENQKLRNDNDRLKKQLNNDSNNSSKPPSSDIKKNIPNSREKTTKKSGGQKGHKAHFLSKKMVEEKINNKEFEHEIIHVGQIAEKYTSKYILDTKISVVAKEYRFYPNKEGKIIIPKEYKTDVQYGNNLKTMCAVLNTEGIVALDRLADFVSCISHEKINISKASIVNFMKELDNKSRYIIKNIEEKILNSELLHTDATTARCENKNICVRTHSTQTHTLLIPTYGKGKKHIEETNILNRYTGNLVHDHETVMYNYGNKHIECNVHVSRYLKGCYENTQNKWALNMRSFLCSLNEYRKKLKIKGILNLEKEQLERYSRRYDELLKQGFLENKKVKSKYLRKDEQRLLNRLKKYKENHLMFLYDFNMPFDNNLSERDLRHVKIKQKVSGHFNSMEGIKIYLNIKSIIGTLKKQGRNFYKEIYNIYEKIPVKI